MDPSESTSSSELLPSLDTESAYIFVTFLLIMSIFSVSISMLANVALNSQRSANAIQNQEVSYQMARAGLSVWMGKSRQDYEINHKNSSEGMSGEACRGLDDVNIAAGLGPSRRTMRCHNSKTGGDTLSENFTHHWGWGFPITDAAADDGDTLLLGEKVYLPSGELTHQAGDTGFFRIKRVVHADGESMLNEEVLMGNEQWYEPCVDPGNDSLTINVNTANHVFLKEIPLADTTTKTIGSGVAEKIIEHRSGSTESTDDPNNNGKIELNEEVYTGSAEPFRNFREFREFLESELSSSQKSDYNKFDVSGNVEFGGGSRKFCAHIVGASVDDEGKVKSRYNLWAKIKGPSNDQREESKGVARIISLEQVEEN